jgi:hypothetical protein
MEALKIIVPFLGVIIGGFILYFLNKSRDQENREYNKRAEIHDRRIKEARDVLEKWTSFIYFSAEVTKIINQEKSLTGITRRLASYDDEFKSIPVMRHEAITKESSIDILNDKELSDLKIELSQKLQLSMQNLTTLEDNLRAIEESLRFGIEKLNVKDISDITKNVELDKSGEALREANKIITKMKIRLDELAKTVK